MLDRVSLTVMPSHEAAAALEKIPEQAGVYMFLLSDRVTVPGANGAGPNRWSDGEIEGDVLYVGATTWSLRERIKSHFALRSESSSMRMSLGLLLAEQLNLQVRTIDTRRSFYFEPEQALTGWLKEHTTTTFFVTDTPMDDERELVARGYGLLNISGAASTEFRRSISAMRSSHSSFRRGRSEGPAYH